jgi:LuxR family maltose regulon positive regulatory protein
MRAAIASSSTERPDGPEPLTPAETRVLRLLPTHRTLINIAQELFVAHSTIKTHSLSVYRKLGVNSRAAAIQRAVELGLLPPDSPPRPTIPRKLRVVPSGQNLRSRHRLHQPSA